MHYLRKNNFFFYNSSLQPFNYSKNKLSLYEFYDKLYSYKLFDFQYKMVENIYKTKNTKLLLATRGIGKTDLITVLLPLYRLYINPHERILIIVNELTRGRRIIKAIGDYIKNHPDLFSYIFDDNDVQKTSIYTKVNIKGKDPSIFLGSTGKQLRGSRPTCIYIDDILTQENSLYPSKRQDAMTTYQECRALVKHTGDITIVGNVTHEEDLHSILRASDSPDITTFELFNDDVPDYFRVNVDEEIAKGSTKRSVMADYFGILIPDVSSPFIDTKVMEVDSLTELNLDSYVCYFDFSNGGDYNATALVFLHNFKIYVLGSAIKCAWSEFIDKVTPYLQLAGIYDVHYETNNVGSEPKRIFEFNNFNKIVGKPTTKNKVVKLQALYPLINDIILLKDKDFTGNSDFIKIFRNFSPVSKSHDDANDVVAMACMELNLIKGGK